MFLLPLSSLLESLKGEFEVLHTTVTVSQLRCHTMMPLLHTPYFTSTPSSSQLRVAVYHLQHRGCHPGRNERSGRIHVRYLREMVRALGISFPPDFCRRHL